RFGEASEKHDTAGVRAAIDAIRRLADAPGGADDLRVQEALGRVLLLANDPGGARRSLEFVAKRRGEYRDHRDLAMALYLIARDAETGAGVTSIDVVPTLRDALLEIEAARTKVPDEPAARRESAVLEAEIRFQLRDRNGALAALADPAMAKD